MKEKMIKVLKAIWKALDVAFTSVLSWCDNKWFAGILACAISFAGYLGAEPILGVPAVNVGVLAFLAGFLMLAVMLFGTSIVKNKEYNLWSLCFSIVGALAGTWAGYFAM